MVIEINGSKKFSHKNGYHNTNPMSLRKHLLLKTILLFSLCYFAICTILNLKTVKTVHLCDRLSW